MSFSYDGNSLTAIAAFPKEIADALDYSKSDWSDIAQSSPWSLFTVRALREIRIESVIEKDSHINLHIRTQPLPLQTMQGVETNVRFFPLHRKHTAKWDSGSMKRSRSPCIIWRKSLPTYKELIEHFV